MLFFCTSPSASAIHTLSLHDALPIFAGIIGDLGHEAAVDLDPRERKAREIAQRGVAGAKVDRSFRSEEHTSELQSRGHIVCRLLLEKKKHLASTCHNHPEREKVSCLS